MPALITLGTAERASADFTLASGDEATLNLISGTAPIIPDGTFAEIQIKSDTDYFIVATLTREAPMIVLSARGTFRVVMKATAETAGVFQSA